ncbi:hypothetical protein BGY98DRAFT_937302 [Russula aff. rugulosa BPL654]|nr:hypothetical protein BGY98DRAFT_937302 [Russula aff. rugulosa BPL654]
MTINAAGLRNGDTQTRHTRDTITTGIWLQCAWPALHEHTGGSHTNMTTTNDVLAQQGRHSKKADDVQPGRSMGAAVWVLRFERSGVGDWCIHWQIVSCVTNSPCGLVVASKPLGNLKVPGIDKVGGEAQSVNGKLVLNRWDWCRLFAQGLGGFERSGGPEVEIVEARKLRKKDRDGTLRQRQRHKEPWGAKVAYLLPLNIWSHLAGKWKLRAPERHGKTLANFEVVNHLLNEAKAKAADVMGTTLVPHIITAQAFNNHIEAVTPLIGVDISPHMVEVYNTCMSTQGLEPHEMQHYTWNGVMEALHCPFGGFYDLSITSFYGTFVPEFQNLCAKEGQVCTWVKKDSYHGDIVRATNPCKAGHSKHEQQLKTQRA